MQIDMVSLPVKDPVAAHGFYTETLGFTSHTFEPDQQLAVITSAEAPDGPTILLEPCGDTFLATYQQQAYDANLPIMVFRTRDLEQERLRLSERGVTFRDDLSRPDWGLDNLFEDTCGNLIMLVAAAS